MKVALQRSPSRSPLLCSSSLLKPTFSLLSVSSFLIGSSSLLPMPCHAAALSSSSSPAATFPHNPKPSSTSRSYYTACRATIGGGRATAGTHLRAWQVGRSVFHRTLSAAEPVGSSSSEDVFKVEEKPAKIGRRQKGSNDVEGNADLLTIPGVGPKNLRKLVEKGLRGMAELKQLYKDKSVDEELKDVNSDDVNNLIPKKQRITFCVEGNISVGKTTFLQRIVSDTIELRDLVEVVPEPIDKWQDIGPDHFNILDAFYAQPDRYAYTFQNYVFVTRVMQERESSIGLKPLRLMERSVFSDRMVFVRAVHEAKWMNEMEISIYDSWFDPVVSVLPGLVPDGFIYLRATPDTCHKRMKHRQRAEEGGVSLDYLRGLHEKHESWLFPMESGNHGIFSVHRPPLQLDSSIHPDIRDQVFFLQGDHMHSSIQKVPALVLDCEANIDLNKDTEAKEHYARQVSAFFKYVKQMKEVSSTPGEAGVPNTKPRQIILPREGGLLLPNGKHFDESALKSLDFRRAISLMSSQ
ncbi:Deoxycytidine kinase [Linum perenne]